MTKFYPYLLVLLSVLLGSYYYDNDSYEPESSYTPILMTRVQMTNSIRTGSAKALENPGKIYLKDHLFFVVEKYEGIHVIDNSDRLTPKKIGFIHIPGCIDLAMKGAILYADNAVDLIAVDISAFPTIEVLSRTENVFPEHTPPDLDFVPYQYNSLNRPEGSYIVAWVEKL